MSLISRCLVAALSPREQLPFFAQIRVGEMLILMSLGLVSLLVMLTSFVCLFFYRAAGTLLGFSVDLPERQLSTKQLKEREREQPP